MRADSTTDLIYVDSWFTKAVYSYSYPAGKLVGKFTGFKFPQGLCSDAKGNVWIADQTGGSYGAGELIEYAHGGAKPIATLNDGGAPAGCSVNPLNGDLAVANTGYGSDSNVAIYAKAHGTPKYYEMNGQPFSCSYDNQGDLFAAAYTGVYTSGLFWLPKGHAQFAKFKHTPEVQPKFGVQWDGQDVSLKDTDNISQFSLRGQEVGVTQLAEYGIGESWISVSTLFGNSGDNIIVWPYPAGGYPTKIIAGERKANTLVGITYSVAPSH